MRGLGQWVADNLIAPIVVAVGIAVGTVAGFALVGYLAYRWLGISWEDFSSLVPPQ